MWKFHLSIEIACTQACTYVRSFLRKKVWIVESFFHPYSKAIFKGFFSTKNKRMNFLQFRGKTAPKASP